MRRGIIGHRGQLYLGFLALILVLGVIGPSIAPYPYDESLYRNGELLRTHPPSVAHPLGTTNLGYDVLSRILVGARPTVITGLIGGTMIAGIGLAVGLTAGYVGGMVENVLMRITDMLYGIPLIPFALVIITFMGVGFLQSIFAIGILLWRANARVIRSQVLQIKERPFVLAAKSTGASTPWILYRHILPNVAPMAILFFAIGTGYTIILQAGLAFIGASNPFVPSWGIMVRNAYSSGVMAEAWWWSITPGVLVALTVLSAFMVGRIYEERLGEDSEEAVAEMG